MTTDPGQPELAAPIPGGAGQRTAALSVVVGVVEGIRAAIFPMVAVLFGSRAMETGGLIALAVGAAIILINAFSQYVRWTRTRYYIGAEDIRLESGLLSREARSVPFERIQDVSLQQKLIPRIFGLTQVTFETGAGGGEDLTFAYVTEQEGERLRELVRERHEAETVPAGAEPVDHTTRPVQEAEGRPIFTMGPRRLFVFGLFEFSLAIFAVLLAAAQQFDFLLPFDLWDWEEWEAIVGEGNARLGTLGRWGQVLGALAGLVGVIGIGLATGVLRTFAREWGYVLSRTAKGFRRRRGLFTRTDVVMPVHRVQAVKLGTRWFRSLFGWHALRFVSLAQDSGSASHVAAPFAQLEEIEPIAQETGILTLPGDGVFIRPPVDRWFDHAVLTSIPVFAIAIGYGASGRPGIGAMVLLIVMPLVIGLHMLAWARHGWRVQDGQLFIREGILAPQVTAAPKVKLQSAEISRGPLGLWRGYADLEVGLAGGTMRVRGLEIGTAEQVREHVVDAIVQVGFADSQASGSQPEPG